MDIVTVSTKYQVVIPQKSREKLGIRPGQKMHVIALGNHLVLIPVEAIENGRGFLKGIDTSLERETDRI